MKSSLSYALPIAAVVLLCAIGFALTSESAARAATLDNSVSRTSTDSDTSGLPTQLDAATILDSAPASAAYPDAAAVTILDSGQDVVQADGSDVLTVHEIKRIFNDRGRDVANVVIQYSRARAACEVLAAFTLNPDGKPVYVKPRDIHDDSASSGHSSDADARVIRFSMPAIQDGSVIDYSYKEVQKPAIPGAYASSWWFNGVDNPVQSSEFTIIAPSTLKINAKLYNTGTVEPVLTEANGTTTYKYTLSNLPAIVPETLMPPLNNVAAEMTVSTLGSWQDISHWYWTLVQDRMVITPDLHKLVVKLTAGKLNDSARARSIFYWVEQNIRPLATSFGSVAYQPHSALSVYENRYGESEDITVLLVTLLRDAGIADANPALVGYYEIKPVSSIPPDPAMFDRSIAVATINGQPVWFDSVLQDCALGEIPGLDRGVDALIVKDGGEGEFVTIPSYDPLDNFLNTLQTVVLKPDGSAACTSQTTTGGDMDIVLRLMYKSLASDQVNSVIQATLSHANPDSTLGKVKLSDVKDRDQPFSLWYTYNAPHWASNTRDLMIFTPQPVTGSGSFTTTPRLYPVYSNMSGQMQSTLTVTAPNGYVIDTVPEDIDVSLPIGEYVRTTTVDGQTLTINTQITSRPANVPASDYASFQVSIIKLREQIGEAVILKKAVA